MILSNCICYIIFHFLFFPWSANKAANYIGAAVPIPGAEKYARSLIKSTGFGNYTSPIGPQPVMNELVDGGHATEGVMRFDVEDDHDTILISHSEYVADLYSSDTSGGVVDLKFDLNPGLLLYQELVNVINLFEYLSVNSFNGSFFKI